MVALLGASGTVGAGIGGLVLYDLAYIAPLVILLVLASRPGLIRVVTCWHLAHAGATKLVLAIVVLALGFAILLAVRSCRSPRVRERREWTPRSPLPALAEGSTPALR